MIIGSYPCCKGHFSEAMPPGGPHYFKEDCPHCEPVWTTHTDEAEAAIAELKRIAEETP